MRFAELERCLETASGQFGAVKRAGILAACHVLVGTESSGVCWVAEGKIDGEDEPGGG